MKPVSEVADDDLLPLRALNDLLFCRRRCALHRTEGLWSDTAHTVEGTQAHQKVHAEGDQERDGGAVRPRAWRVVAQ